MKRFRTIAWLALGLLVSNTLWAQAVSNYLILQDIGDYRFITQTKGFITGKPRAIPGHSVRTASGILTGADHFDMDHDDITYESGYSNRDIKLYVDVQVTQHAGGDSDKWLLHEIDISFRNYYGIPSLSYDVEAIGGKHNFDLYGFRT